MSSSSDDNNKNVVSLPPGFRFNPTDKELILHFLYRKESHLPCVPDIIPDLALSPYDPWDLCGKALEGESNKWYFFSRRTSNRVSGSGYWTAMDVDEHEEQILIPQAQGTKKLIGVKKYLVFYMAQGIKTNWIMHEYRLLDSHCYTTTTTSTSSMNNSRSTRRSGLNPETLESTSKWVLCRVFEQSNGGCSQGSCFHGENDDNHDDGGTELSGLDEVFLSLDDLDDISLPYQS